MTKSKDLNDRLLDGTMPADPFSGAVVSEEFPRIVTAGELMQDALKAMFDQSPRQTCSFSHPDLDEATGGAIPGEVTFLGADSSWGKSSYALMVADENAKGGKKVLVVSAEDSQLMFASRLLRRRARISASDLRHRRSSAEDKDSAVAAAAKSDPFPYFIDARSKTVEWLAPRIKEAVAEHGIDMLIADYVGAFNKSKNLNDQGQRGATQYIARVLVDICKTCTPTGIAGLVLSQITQDEKQPIPGKYALRDSKDLVHMAENVLIGFIAPHELKDGSGNVIAREGDRCLKVAKAKEGEAGKTLVVLPWNAHSACFDAVPSPEKRRTQRDESDPFAGSFEERRSSRDSSTHWSDQ